MVHTLLLVLGVGLVCAHLDHVPELKPSEVSGAWHTLYIGADNVEKVGPGGPLRALLRHLECGDTCKLLSVTFDIKVDNDCQSYTVVGEKDKDGFYTTDFLGKNYFKMIKKEKDVIVFHNFNVDVDGKETNIILVAGRGDDLTNTQKEELEGLADEFDIPKKNIQHVVSLDTCTY